MVIVTDNKNNNPQETSNTQRFSPPINYCYRNKH